MTIPTALRLTTLDREEWDQDSLDEGQGLGMAACGFTTDQFEREGWPEAAIIAWEREVEAAIVEIGPQVRDLLYQALQRRLPWEPS